MLGKDKDIKKRGNGAIIFQNLEILGTKQKNRANIKELLGSFYKFNDLIATYEILGTNI